MATWRVLGVGLADAMVANMSRAQGGRAEISPSLLKAGVIGGEDLDGLRARVLLTVARGVPKAMATIQR